MNPVAARTIVHATPLLCTVFYIVLFVAFISEASEEKLPEEALALAITLMVVIPLCVGSLCVLKCYPGAHPSPHEALRRKLALGIQVLSVFTLHVVVTVLMIVGYVTDDCTDSIMALCTAGKENFFIVVIVCTFVQLAFLTFEVAIYTYATNNRVLSVGANFPQGSPLYDAQDNEIAPTNKTESSDTIVIDADNVERM
jgi:ACR3 family arsenite efflux pump ArsB